MTQRVDVLTPVTEAQRSKILNAPKTSAVHQELMAEIPAMTTLETGGAGSRDKLPSAFGAAAWNLERCLFVEATAAHLAPHGLDLILLSEMDNGMSRTAQRNTTADLAAELGMHYTYGVEFFEMGLGGPTEAPFCKDDFNKFGWHGNGILSSAPFRELRLIRLDRSGHWFATGDEGAGDPEQPRIGGRMAVAAIIDTENGPICAVSTHLESNADAAFRHKQYTLLLDEIDDFAPDMPVLIGGDLNTGNHIPPDFNWRVETLFELAEKRGYSWDLTAEGPTTRPSLITPHPTRKMTLDWFCSRGIGGAARPVLSSQEADGRPLSDHDCMLCDVEMRSQ